MNRDITDIRVANELLKLVAVESSWVSRDQISYILAFASDAKPDNSFLIGPVLYHTPELTLDKLSGKAIRAVNLFCKRYQQSPATFGVAYEAFRRDVLAVYEHHRVSLYARAHFLGQASLVDRDHAVNAINKHYQNNALKGLTAYQAFIENLSLYLALIYQIKIPLLEYTWKRLSNKKISIILNDKHTYRIEKLPTSLTRKHYLVKVDKATARVIHTHIIHYLGAKDKRTALNELYLKEPVLFFFNAYTTRFDQSFFYSPFDSNKVKNELTITPHYRPFDKVTAIIHALNRSNQSLRRLLGKRVLDTDLATLKPLATLSKHTLELQGDYDEYMLTVAYKRSIQAHGHLLSNALSAASNMMTVMAIFYAATPIGPAVGALSAIVSMGTKTYQFFDAANKQSFKKALNLQPNAGGFLKVVEARTSLAKEASLLLLELMFFVPAMKSATAIKKLRYQERSIIKKSKKRSQLPASKKSIALTKTSTRALHRALTNKAVLTELKHIAKHYHTIKRSISESESILVNLRNYISAQPITSKHKDALLKIIDTHATTSLARHNIIQEQLLLMDTHINVVTKQHTLITKQAQKVPSSSLSNRTTQLEQQANRLIKTQPRQLLLDEANALHSVLEAYVVLAKHNPTIAALPTHIDLTKLLALMDDLVKLHSQLNRSSTIVRTGKVMTKTAIKKFLAAQIANANPPARLQSTP